MTRSMLLWDRLVVFLLGALLVAFAVFGVLWMLGTWPYFPETFDLSAAAAWPETGWWSWALLAAGVVLVILGLVWLVRHARRERISTLNLSGTAPGNTLRVDASGVASAAAEAMADTLGVRSARGHVDRDRGHLVTTILVTLEQDASLDEIARRADEVATDLQQSLGREDVECRIELKIARRPALTGSKRSTVH